MDKPVRNAFRCYLIKDNKVVVTKYSASRKKQVIMIYQEENN